MPKMIFIFLDGVGIGSASRTNPFFAADADYLCFYENPPGLPDGTPIKPIDARLGVEGMPMSATGQTSLFTGVNMPMLLGAHKDSYPDKPMRKIIKERNLFSCLKKNSIRVQFLNAYPGSAHFYTPENVRIRGDGDFYFSHFFQGRSGNNLSVTTCMMISSFTRVFGEKEIKQERALYHDYTNESLRQSGFDLPKFSPEKAAEIIFNTARDFDLLLYEFFQTDMYGHGFSLEECMDLIRDLNRLIKHLVSLMDGEKDTLLITSDHGNLEDSLTPMHTANPVPLIAWGRDAEDLRQCIDNLSEIAPAIVDFFHKKCLKV
jgi:2,3-bisphosphoglycerate-independent phosphoglycerate mutase